MNDINVGDLIWAKIKHPWESPQYEWSSASPGDEEGSWGIVQRIFASHEGAYGYNVIYPDGSGDILDRGDFVVKASVGEKNFRQAAPSEDELK